MPTVMRPLLLAGLCALALSAPAQDPQVAPGSPAGTEYQLPVDRAREEAGGGSGGESGGRPGGSDGSGGSRGAGPSGEAPLFGAGVGEKPTTGAPSAKSAAHSKPTIKAGTKPDRGPTKAGAKPERGSSVPATVRAQAPAPDGGGGLVAVGVGAGGVLLLGGLAGLAWRRRTARP